MFKRFQKSLRGDEEGSSDSSDESELSQSFDDDDLDVEASASDVEDVSEDSDSDEAPGDQNDDASAESSQEDAAPVPVGVVTEEELAAAENNPAGAEEDEYNYHCTLCPHKVLASLHDVQAHLKSKAHLARERRAAQMTQMAEQFKHLDPPSQDSDVEVAAPSSSARKEELKKSKQKQQHQQQQTKPTNQQTKPTNQQSKQNQTKHNRAQLVATESSSSSSADEDSHQTARKRVGSSAPSPFPDKYAKKQSSQGQKQSLTSSSGTDESRGKTSNTQRRADKAAVKDSVSSKKRKSDSAGITFPSSKKAKTE